MAVMMIGNDVLPHDVMLIILSRLPVKILKRFTCVCKSWFATFQNRKFIRNHYTTNTIVASNINVIVRTMNPSSTITDHNYAYYLLSSNPTKDEVNETVSLSCFKNYNFRTMVGECEGLILCMCNATSVALFNPATQQVKLLPQPCIEHDGILYALGIGYDYKTNDYKVVRLLKNYDKGGIYHVELYALSTNSWKEIRYDSVLDEHFDGITYSNFSTYLNGCYHWLTDGTKGVLVFDMTQEIFQTMTFPAHLLLSISNNEDIMLTNLRVFDGHLAFFVRSKDVRDCFEIYVMKEYGVEESWTKQLVIGPILGVEEILGSYRGGGDQWVFSTHEHDTGNYQMKLYDNRTKMVKDLGKNFTAWEVESVMFTENLLSLNRSNGQYRVFTSSKQRRTDFFYKLKERLSSFACKFKQSLAKFLERFKRPFAAFFCKFMQRRAMAHEELLFEYRHQSGPMRLGYEMLSMTDVVAKMRIQGAIASSVVGLTYVAFNTATRTLTMKVEGSVNISDINKKVKRVSGPATTTLKTFETALPAPPAT